MRIEFPNLFGSHLITLRTTAGVPMQEVARRLGMDPRMYYAIEQGRVEAVDDDILTELEDHLPGFRLSIAPGIHGQPVPYDGLTKAERQGLPSAPMPGARTSPLGHPQRQRPPEPAQPAQPAQDAPPPTGIPGWPPKPTPQG